MEYNKWDSIIGVGLACIMLGFMTLSSYFGYTAGITAGITEAQAGILRHSCDSACVAIGSKMSSQAENLCVCEDLTTMRGEYRQLFLHGRETTRVE